MPSFSAPTPQGPLARATLVGALAVASLLLPFAAAVPVVRGATPPKVVIVVGPVGSTTASYRTDAEKAAAEALKYTPNVVTIYSPNATWAAVKPQLQGASIVIYMGHGNGFPSPHTSTIAPDRQDGLGLNPSAGVDDSTTTYIGEKTLAAEVRLTPNAVVILGHLCYASGSSEPGYADPSQAVAQQRVDNYAAGFIGIGASAVIAEAYNNSAANYIRALFTTHDSIGNIWANSSSRQGHTFSFASTRTSGATVEMDPDKSSGKYYRALTGDLSLTSDAVLAGADAVPPLATDPTASPSPTPTPSSSPGPVASPSPTPTPTPSPSPTSDAGKGTTGAGLLATITAPAAFSPNGDGRQDTFPFKAKLTASAAWGVSITDDAGGVYAADNGSGSAVNVEWDGTSNGARMSDGTYSYHLVATAAGGSSFERSGSFRVDTQAPLVTAASQAAPATFSPNGDGSADTWSGTFAMSEPGALDATVVSGSGILVRHLTANVAGPTGTLTWNGRTDSGSGVADGAYNVVVAGRDLAGNASATQAVGVVVYRALSKVAASTTLFYPQDRDAYAPSTRLSFALTAPATVTWTINDASGAIVATHDAATALPARALAWIWNGKNDAGAFVAPGSYAATLTATNGTLTDTEQTTLTVAAFQISTGAAPAARGQNVTVTVVSAEPLAAAPRLTLTQPGVAARTVTLVRAGTNTWRITTKLSAKGSAGKLGLKVVGTDARKGSNVATAVVPLR